MTSFCKCSTCIKIHGQITGETIMHKSDKNAIFRGSIEEMKDVGDSVKAKYDKAYLEGRKTEAQRLLKLYFKIEKLLEIEE